MIGLARIVGFDWDRGAVDEGDLSLRLPVDLLERIKMAANRRDVLYQSLIKVWLAEKVDAA